MSNNTISQELVGTAELDRKLRQVFGQRPGACFVNRYKHLTMEADCYMDNDVFIPHTLAGLCSLLVKPAMRKNVSFCLQLSQGFLSTKRQEGKRICWDELKAFITSLPVPEMECKFKQSEDDVKSISHFELFYEPLSQYSQVLFMACELLEREDFDNVAQREFLATGEQHQLPVLYRWLTIHIVHGPMAAADFISMSVAAQLEFIKFRSRFVRAGGSVNIGELARTVLEVPLAMYPCFKFTVFGLIRIVNAMTPAYRLAAFLRLLATDTTRILPSDLYRQVSCLRQFVNATPELRASENVDFVMRRITRAAFNPLSKHRPRKLIVYHID